MATQAKRDYYEILSVTRTATETEIRAAFQKLTAEFHAGGRPKNIEDVEEIRSMVTAYRVLSDPTKKHDYDQHGNAALLTDPVSTWSDQVNMNTSHSWFWWSLGNELGTDLFDFINDSFSDS